MTARSLALAAAMGLALSGLVVPPVAAAPAITWTACPENLGAPRGTGCTTLDVPLDYAKPAGRQITLTLAAAGHLNAPNILVVNPGGPGESGIGTPKLVWSALPPELADKYLVVSFDPRGVGASSPVSCGETTGLFGSPQPPYTPAGPEQEKQRVDIARKVAAQCAEKSKDLLPHITTENAARDMDRIRVALGQTKLDYLGYSYGTKLGATYVTLFPSTSGRIVLDSVVNPTASDYELAYEQNPALQHRAGQFFAWVATHDSSYHLGTTQAAVSQAWQGFRDKLAAQPVEKKVGIAELDDMLASSMYTDITWPDLARAVADYRDGNPGGLIAATNSLIVGAVNAPQLAYNCVDGKWPGDWRTWHEDTVASARKAPLFAWLNTWYSAPCAFWGVPAAKPVKIGSGKVPPVLLVQAKDDAATPVGGARKMQRAFPGSRLVLSEGGNHSQFLFDRNACVDKPVVEYLKTGTLPAADLTCPASPPPNPS